ncbi:hypothetical protein VTN77DRAFT_9773 [Rasamsonia byssochlamydoides]|uniref:uncharacterized protein n=1 Tax=Rasamsonia byssochlamydoides TaxID=89139 RepID=UPI003743DEC3
MENPMVVIVNRCGNDSSRKTYLLSGIGKKTCREEPLDVPLDKNMVTEEAYQAGYLGQTTRVTTMISRATWGNSENSDKFPHGYPFHAKCWSLIERYIGNHAELRLDRLITAVGQRWYLGSYGLKDLTLMERSCKPWIPYCIKAVVDTVNDDFLFQMDPLDIFAVKNLVKKNTKASRCKSRRIIQRTSSLASGPMHGQGPQQCLPLDLHLQILDLLQLQTMSEDCICWFQDPTGAREFAD